ncbi:23S rRNA (adenosine(1067)-2'-O)-methyltransferase [Austwickia sp. TVS 96-490-7B]|uniref:TrmH family RNA methyltransferase n=1 Tax=Austwickia sp. TVS 96-490-7B TaxID=2830843 RepID=UPI001C59A0CA|nr:TrmH family RNA methyltransferase [Austwickia sp. TVS 96-490-7B]MBW3085264.1 23S rRNA (adenosine(1067)-2'-O)-methyltransferase [Austwickia sp. TVS 96-490-7B]
MSLNLPDPIIDDKHDARVRKVVDLLKGKNKRTRVMIIDDEENIAEALRQGIQIFTVFISEGTDLSADLVDLLADDLDIQQLSIRLSKELFGVERRSRVFALALKPRPWKVSELLDLPGDVVILDGVRLMGNIGAITRSAKALGASGILLLDSALDTVMDRRLIRASRGGVFSLPIALADADTVLPELADRGIRIVALEPRAPQPLSSIAALPGRVALLLGSEKHGPSAAMSAHADPTVTIEIHPDVESLNVSVSAALALYERRAGAPWRTDGHAGRVDSRTSQGS